ncbi:MAG: hypothetical protein RBR86_09620 [Pseudobdellovibrionaceae bacterium]|jgi:hypothetical protein|nr:hypothetical protein [Pseudobdellovibrionaceae bacterium]
MPVSLQEFKDRQIILKNAYDAIVSHEGSPLQMKDAGFFLGEWAASANRNTDSTTRIQSLTNTFLKAAQARTRFHVFTLIDLVLIDQVSKQYAQEIGRQDHPYVKVHSGCWELVSRRRDQLLNIQIKMINFERLRMDLAKAYPLTTDEVGELRRMRGSLKVAANISNNHIQIINLRERTGIVDWNGLVGSKQEMTSASALAEVKDRLIQSLPVEADAAQQEVYQALIFLDMVKCHQHWLGTLMGDGFAQAEQARLAVLGKFLENHAQIGIDVSGMLPVELEKIASMGDPVSSLAKMPVFK